ncbi:hypothetical protein Nepgr_031297 [Nepenthes gracilis]|uniref:Uncharacterized protein n=1 Tax=Nepenthes gracilis TaxID=150966 RepID=A0AAD3THU9_NEPGR|nr:hypothetical protein Nepgr_031297 [Nepenthes gracilis]
MVHPPDQMLDAKALKESSSAHVILSSNGMGCVLCSSAANSDSKPAEADEAMGPKAEQKVSSLPLEPSGNGVGCGTSFSSPLASIQTEFGLKLKPTTTLFQGLLLVLRWCSSAL